MPKITREKFYAVAQKIWGALIFLAILFFVIGVATENLVVYYITTVLFFIVFAVPVADFLYKLVTGRNK